MVRGRKFKSTKACAKAFGLSEKHVKDMLAAGKRNSIGKGGGRAKAPLDQRMKVTVRGVTFPTVEACAAHFKITVSAVYSSVATGKADRIGLGKGKQNRGKPTGRGNPVDIGPFKFTSAQSASVFLGFSKGYVAMALRREGGASWPGVIARAMAKAAEMDAAQRHARLKEQVAA